MISVLTRLIMAIPMYFGTGSWFEERPQETDLMT